ncbi:MAG: metal ABC transporter permease [Rhodospirillaceae bacterium]|nr:metal ABC transporter permease [Rhodospirillaceae bacterium]
METLLIFAPAFVAGLVVILTGVPLGREVLRSGIVFLDLAIAQAAGLGVILAGVGEHGAGDLSVQLSAGAAALAAAGLLSWTERFAGRFQEALIGTLFVITASIGIIALSSNPHGGEHLKDLLVGQILWVGWSDLIPVAIIYALLLVTWFGFGARIGRIGFYVVFAVMVTVSVQLVGVYLVFGTLIVPALGVHRFADNKGLGVAYLIALLGYVLGFAATTVLDLPAGPVIVCILAVVALIVACIPVKRAEA